jgi:hypothetical protein
MWDLAPSGLSRFEIDSRRLHVPECFSSILLVGIDLYGWFMAGQPRYKEFVNCGYLLGDGVRTDRLVGLLPYPGWLSIKKTSYRIIGFNLGVTTHDSYPNAKLGKRGRFPLPKMAQRVSKILVAYQPFQSFSAARHPDDSHFLTNYCFGDLIPFSAGFL